MPNPTVSKLLTRSVVGVEFIRHPLNDQRPPGPEWPEQAPRQVLEHLWWHGQGGNRQQRSDKQGNERELSHTNLLENGRGSVSGMENAPESLGPTTAIGSRGVCC